MTLRARDTVTGELVVLTPDPASADHLPVGTVENERYTCISCGKALSLSKRSGPHSSYAPRFAHGGRRADEQDVCAARADVRDRVDQEVQVVIDLHKRLEKAWPGTPTRIDCPEPQGDGGPTPPVIVARDGDQVVVIESPRGVLTEASVRRRIEAVRYRYGVQAQHVWFFAEDLLHFRQGGLKDKAVRPAGESQSVRHRRIRPTEQQLQIIAGGGAVYWVDGDNVLVPYGGHDFLHEPRWRGEALDWSGEIAWRRQDWEISQPVPAPGAQWWGLVPIGLSTLRGGKVGFHPAEAHEVMERLERSQQARWNSSKNEALKQARRKEELRRRPPLPEPVTPSVPAPAPSPPPVPADHAAATPPSPRAETPAVPPPPATPPSPVPPRPENPPTPPRPPARPKARRKLPPAWRGLWWPTPRRRRKRG
ncbi:hypothetical protein [Streptomyces sp. NBC_01304]|uniref:hypothetical protein n=1 Tax=Streptomyces sp. NBC_01304 TaxID=2903818 RepID=UPI002E120D31|nr:hypothetical protein OG430_48890 [Streptomyces sp. NBC_01304]